MTPLPITAGQLLLIEDDALDAERMIRWIRSIDRFDLEVIWVTTLAEALRTLDEHDPIVIVVDLTLPDARGLDCIHAIFDRSPSCPVIVQTGVDDPETPIAALELGAQDYLVKGRLDREVIERSLRHSLARHHTLMELTRRTDELHETDAELDDFAHVVAHDLRAPVRTARLFADRLLHSLGGSNSLAIEFGERLDECLGQVDSMILSMLDYAALRQQFPARSPVPIDRLVKTSLELMSADIADVAGSTTVDLEGDLYVDAESDLLIRVLLNIVANSVNYRAPNRPLHIAVSGRQVGKTIELMITDNGKGVPAEASERVFQILERLEPGATSGLGFGLAISRRIVNGFDGSIWIEPAELVGTTVHIHLPAGQPISPLAALSPGRGRPV